MSAPELFFVALTMPEPVASEIREFQFTMAGQFHAKRALRSPPHITLVPPFRAGAADQPVISKVVAEVAGDIEPFDVNLNGFGAFGKRVIFVAVEQEPRLSALAFSLIERLHKAQMPVRTEERGFHPHVTLAFKDLRQDVFEAAFGHFHAVDFRRRFKCTSVAILCNTAQGWHVVKEILFES